MYFPSRFVFAKKLLEKYKKKIFFEKQVEIFKSL